ncbi:hypothetical protein S40285_10565 [Stachybotrys chlorohalonatus IBT 40285]|uniref:Uncharacterized protein n=1 Tax=Stachybotrys chlorohalonatus (strain IBT 40285) TaxID=1283841 RepID=A0A084Q7N7_STAC4|nr:hypothetical protein S40285_10565 [Stachybotrys chlorohalonata IBT 40285]
MESIHARRQVVGRGVEVVIISQQAEGCEQELRTRRTCAACPLVNGYFPSFVSLREGRNNRAHANNRGKNDDTSRSFNRKGFARPSQRLGRILRDAVPIPCEVMPIHRHAPPICSNVLPLVDQKVAVWPPPGATSALTRSHTFVMPAACVWLAATLPVVRLTPVTCCTDNVLPAPVAVDHPRKVELQPAGADRPVFAFSYYVEHPVKVASHHGGRQGNESDADAVAARVRVL